MSATKEVTSRSNIGQRIRTEGRITSQSATRRPKKKDAEQIPLKNPHHEYVVLNEGHRHKKIISEEAVFRIVRLVSCKEEAGVIVKQHSQYNDIPFILHKTHSWKLLSPKTYTPVQELDRINEIYNERLELIKKSKDDFETYCTEKKEMARKDANDPEYIKFKNKEIDILKKAKQTKGTAASTLNSNQGSYEDLCISQRYAVVGIIEGKNGEVLINIFGAFPSITESKQYAQDTLSDEYEAFDISCVDTNQWIYPSVSHHKDIERGYRHTQLDKMMTYKQGEASRICAHAKKCKSMGVPMRVTEIDVDAVAATKETDVKDEVTKEMEDEVAKEMEVTN